jgi:hypothetical protein
MQRYESLPAQFYLQDLAAITGRVCELRVNPHQAEADRAARSWFNQCVSFTVHSLCFRLTKRFRCSVYDDRKKSKFLNYGKFDLFAALSFPDADCRHLETCIMFFFWAFSVRKLVAILLVLLAHNLNRPTIFLMKATSSQNLTQCKPDMISQSLFIPTQTVRVRNTHMLQCSMSVYFRCANSMT